MIKNSQLKQWRNRTMFLWKQRNAEFSGKRHCFAWSFDSLFKPVITGIKVVIES